MGVVVLRPRLAAHVAEQVTRPGGWPGLAEQVEEAGVAARDGGVALPGGLPRGGLLEAEAFGPGQFAVPVGVEAVVGLTSAAERLPAAGLPAVARALRVGQPGEEVVEQVVADQGVEVEAVQFAGRRLDPEFGHRDIDQPVEAAADRGGRGGVPGQLEPEAAVLGLEEGGDGPVLAVDLRPEGAAILQFGQGLEFAGALLGGPEGRAADAGQVEDGDGARRDRDARDLAREHAAEPDGGAGAVRLVVGPEGEDVRQGHAEAGHEPLPLALLVGPQDGSRGDRVVRIVGGGPRERLDQGVQDRRGQGSARGRVQGEVRERTRSLVSETTTKLPGRFDSITVQTAWSRASRAEAGEVLIGEDAHGNPTSGAYW